MGNDKKLKTELLEESRRRQREIENTLAGYKENDDEHTYYMGKLSTWHEIDKMWGDGTENQNKPDTGEIDATDQFDEPIKSILQWSHCLVINVNDTFMLNCADCIQLDVDDLRWVAPIVQKFGDDGMLACAAYIRKTHVLAKLQTDQYWAAFRLLEEQQPEIETETDDAKPEQRRVSAFETEYIKKGYYYNLDMDAAEKVADSPHCRNCDGGTYRYIGLKKDKHTVSIMFCDKCGAESEI